jgi:DNA adenine methylase
MSQNATIAVNQAEVEPRPFLKWAGGKSSILSEIMSSIPRKFERYVEPFLGGGAVFFRLTPSCALLSDSNEELINCYSVVRDRPDDLLRLLGTFSTSKSKFYEIRKLDPASLDHLTRAARLIYLNKLCYNGLYRVNKKGQFNTPYGAYKNAKLADEGTMIAASSALKHAELLTADFETVLLELSQPGDFFYLDPPYPAVGKYSDFKRYTKAFFNEEDHLRLAKAVYELDKRGNKFLLSNANHPLILELYSRFRVKSVEAPRFVNCKGDRRGRVPELLVTNT